MTSQGAGEPFATGETIGAWHQCGLTGTAYLMPGGDGEKLTGISAGDTAVFRYVKSDAPYKKAVVRGAGSGKVRIMLDDAEIGCTVLENGCCEAALTDTGSGERTLKLVFEDVQDLELYTIVLE